MSRIESSSVQLGSSFVVGGLQASKTQEFEIKENELVKEELSRIEQIKAAAENEAAQILAKAQEEAQNILSGAQEEVNNAVEEAKQFGYNEGYSQGQNQILQEQTENLNMLKGLTNSALEVKKKIISSSEKEIIELVVLIAEKLTKAKFEEDTSLVSNILKSAISELKDRETVNILVNPSLLNAVSEISEELQREINGLDNIKLIPDKTVSADGVIVESLETRIDARLATQVSEITRQMMTEYAKSSLNKELPAEIDEIIENEK